MIFAFDIGTTILKGGIIDQEGTLVAHSRKPYLSSLQKKCNNPGASPSDWIHTFKIVSKKLMHEYNKLEYKRQVQGVVISGNGPTFVPVDTHGKPVCGVISWNDRQSRNYNKELNDKIKGEINPSFYLAKAYKLFKKNPHMYEKVRWFLPCPEYINFYLTENAYAILPANGYKSYMWTGNAIRKAGMDNEKFPPFTLMGEEIGRIKQQVSKETGIPEGIPVFAGGPDFIMSLLGTNTVSPGRVCDRTGTSEGINVCSENPVNARNLYSLPHIKPGLFNISCILSSSGKTLDWFLRLSGKKSKAYKKMYSYLSHLPPGSNNLFFLPLPENRQSNLWPPYRKGVFIGLTEEHITEHLFKAITEGLTYAIREIFDLFEKNGFYCEKVRVSGIQASYKEWNKMRAHILGKRILVPHIWDTELTGGACVGFTSLKYFPGFCEAADHLVRFEKEYIPDKKIQEAYNDMYHLYKRIYKQTDSILKDMA